MIEVKDKESAINYANEKIRRAESIIKDCHQNIKRWETIRGLIEKC